MYESTKSGSGLPHSLKKFAHGNDDVVVHDKVCVSGAFGEHELFVLGCTVIEETHAVVARDQAVFAAVNKETWADYRADEPMALKSV